MLRQENFESLVLAQRERAFPRWSELQRSSLATSTIESVIHELTLFEEASNGPYEGGGVSEAPKGPLVSTPL